MGRRMHSQRTVFSGLTQTVMDSVTTPSAVFEMIVHKIRVHRQLMCRVAQMAMVTDIPIHMVLFAANSL